MMYLDEDNQENENPKGVLAGAQGLRISNPPSLKPFKGFQRPVQVAGPLHSAFHR